MKYAEFKLYQENDQRFSGNQALSPYTPRHPDDSRMLTGTSLSGAYTLLAYAELMRLYNVTNDPASPIIWLTSSQQSQFIVRDPYIYSCPRSSGKNSSKEDGASSYSKALRDHQGKSWRIMNNKDLVTHIPPVLPLRTWNRVDNEIRIFPDEAPSALPSEVDTQPSVNFLQASLEDHGKSEQVWL